VLSYSWCWALKGQWLLLTLGLLGPQQGPRRLALLRCCRGTEMVWPWQGRAVWAQGSGWGEGPRAGGLRALSCLRGCGARVWREV
jgi:hypothetical protein